MIDYEVWINGKTYRALVMISASRTLFMLMSANGGTTWVVGCVKKEYWSVRGVQMIYVSSAIDKLGELNGANAFWQAYDLIQHGILTEKKMLETQKSQAI